MYYTAEPECSGTSIWRERSLNREVSSIQGCPQINSSPLYITFIGATAAIFGSGVRDPALGSQWSGSRVWDPALGSQWSGSGVWDPALGSQWSGSGVWDPALGSQWSGSGVWDPALGSQWSGSGVWDPALGSQWRLQVVEFGILLWDPSGPFR